MVSLSAVIYIFLGIAAAKPYKPGNPGGPWKESHAVIIRDKLIHIWDNQLKYADDFDNNNTQAKSTDWLYDPTFRLSKVDCDWNIMLCRTYWGAKRKKNLAFSPPKAVR